jgi:hypothetical protein
MVDLAGAEECFSNSKGVAATFALLLKIVGDVSRTDLLKVDAGFQVAQQELLLPTGRRYLALASGFSRPSTNECALKINEAVLEECQTEELKNFTHGKHLLPYLDRSSWSFILFSTPESLPMVTFLEEH